MNKKLLVLILLASTAGLFGVRVGGGGRGFGGGRGRGVRGPGGGRGPGGWHHDGRGHGGHGYRGHWRDNRWITGPYWWPGALFGGIFYNNYYDYCLATGTCAPGWLYWT